METLPQSLKKKIGKTILLGKEVAYTKSFPNNKEELS